MFFPIWELQRSKEKKKSENNKIKIWFGGRDRVKKVIGITGGLGAGKTTLIRQMQKFGIKTVTADEVNRKLVKRGSPVLRSMVATFGKTILTSSGELDRGKVGRWVFQNPSALKRLNRLTHPQMRHMIDAALKEWKGRGIKLIAIEAAVLFEMGLRPFVNEVWVLTASFRERLKRMEKSEQGTRDKGKTRVKRETILQRMVRQLSDVEFSRRAHRVIVTDGRRQNWEMTERMVTHEK
ncbi:MAG: dephospho-CoA kinase [Armatimonadetes bacterium]|nr:dephospho-CoA kinase [Armatimonadota bacterium]